ncbi:hypothetical protein [Paenibacillus cremeus]|uniref:Uncharacterized protein n=1 Tax=Paenibacillus cremeus TaxID=2163881 RepID=A0A559K645_9BACL|nr:hypothetical protein [Paenibacillus cremeus]TVY07602.1 hypothetical protein FPZ49_22930 [Paenibacillus cremeus]
MNRAARAIEQREQGRIRLRLGMLLVLLIATVAGTVYWISTSTSKNSESNLTVRLAFTRSSVIIENGDTDLWSGVTIRLNGEYTYTVDRLPRGAGSVPWTAFHNAAGEPFNAQRTTAHQLTLEVEEGPGGKPGHWKW